MESAVITMATLLKMMILKLSHFPPQPMLCSRAKDKCRWHSKRYISISLKNFSRTATTIPAESKLRHTHQQTLKVRITTGNSGSPLTKNRINNKAIPLQAECKGIHFALIWNFKIVEIFFEFILSRKAGVDEVAFFTFPFMKPTVIKIL